MSCEWIGCSALPVSGAMAPGLLLCAAWYYTILAGFYILYCPVMYLMFFHHKLYRKIVDVLFALWELYPVALFQCCSNAEMHHYGDYVNPDERTIIVMNHRTRVDWNYVWIALYHATQSGIECACKKKPNAETTENHVLDVGGRSKIKFVLKDELKAVPGMGWIMQLNFFLYVKRNWREDQLSLAQFVDYYKRLSCPCRIVLFPEGTDLSEENKRRSERFATTHNLLLYEYVLHPRTTGFAALCSRLRGAGLASVYDATVAYDVPAQTEADLLRGNMPKHIYFHFKRYPIEDLPLEDDMLKSWLHDRWREKESSLRKFHKNGQFVDSATRRPPAERPPRSLHAALLGFTFWLLVDALFAYALLTNVLFRFWVLYHTFLFIFVTWYFGGFQNIQYKLSESLKV
ncbi:lysocardiolipin acyltransferase 1-like [Cydia amplana]|uniref:lysocardiolipin acyltransferase 1-like n=1 Tax=Cydia amplana TaxID=1869771 RepID=UPI002FE5E0D2